MRLGSLRLAPHQKINWPGIFPRKIKRVVLYCAVLYTPRERGHGGPHAGHHHLATPPALHSSRHMALQMMMQSSRFVVDPGPRPRPRPTAAAHSNTFCLPPPPPSPILTSFLVCACASATCNPHPHPLLQPAAKDLLVLVSFPELSGPLPCACPCLSLPPVPRVLPHPPESRPHHLPRPY